VSRRTLPVGARLAFVAAALLAAACNSDANESPTPSAASYPDFTILSKTIYPDSTRVIGAVGEVTVFFAGAERAIAVSGDCYRSARVGTVLPEDCR